MDNILQRLLTRPTVPVPPPSAPVNAPPQPVTTEPPPKQYRMYPCLRTNPQAKVKAKPAAIPSTPTPPFTPAVVAQVYGVSALPVKGAGQVIAIVDAYAYPTVGDDTAQFCRDFGLKMPTVLNNPSRGSLQSPAPPGTFILGVYQMSPNLALPADNGWQTEQALDVQWAHAIAPDATILLVQTVSDALADLLAGVDQAVALGATIVSMSFGGSEFPSETFFDQHFNNPNVLYIAAAGDTPGVFYPAASPKVVSVGGTSLVVAAGPGGSFIRGSETAWSSTAGGLSAYEPEPDFQEGTQTSNKRDDNDVAFLADPATGVLVYSTATPANGPVTPGAYYCIGGTSLACPCWAAILALVNQQRALIGKAGLTFVQLEQTIYNFLASTNTALYSATFVDIGAKYTANTGIGAPIVNSLVMFLAAL